MMKWKIVKKKNKCIKKIIIIADYILEKKLCIMKYAGNDKLLNRKTKTKSELIYKYLLLSFNT